MRPEASEQRRQKGNMIRLGTIAQLDLAAARCRVKTGELTSDWIPWLVPRVGTTIEWSAPSMGEQGLVLCPDGDTSGAVFLRGLYSDALPAPSNNAHIHRTTFPDGSEQEHDDQTHTLRLQMAEGRLHIQSPTVLADGSGSFAGNLGTGTGASGTFTTPSGAVVTVERGIVTNIF